MKSKTHKSRGLLLLIAGTLLLMLPTSYVKAQNVSTPFFGAQVFIEPGQAPEEIDTWFRVMKENNLSVCRIRMFESYMRKDDGTWDFSLFDNAFLSAEKHGIKVYATIFPYTAKTDIGGFKFPRDDEHLASVASFIKVLTTHFGKFPSLYGWVLINEPGVGGNVPWTDFSKKKYEEWLKRHPQSDFNEKGYPILMSTIEQQFLVDFNTWYLRWIADEIKKYNTGHEIHVNNHAMFQNCAEYDFPSWRNFLTSLGGSAHASWHFGYFTRQQYAMAMSANSEIVRSGAGNLPWIMTELQGGNNLYTGGTPMCPTKEEIAQWLWIITASEGRGNIFWCLNPRSSGIEAGEWALLNYQNEPSDRLDAVKAVAATVSKNADIFAAAREVESGINILYVRESMWVESKIAEGSTQNYEARKPGAVMKSALAYFEALSELGINSNLKEFAEFDFSKDDYSGQAIVLAHQIAIPNKYVTPLEHFVKNGGKLIVDGLTAHLDENLHMTMKTGFPFINLFGGNISEFKLLANLFDIEVEKQTMPAHLWRGCISPTTGKPISGSANEISGIRNSFGKGEVTWVPSLLGLGSRIKGDYIELAAWLTKELSLEIKGFPVVFKSLEKNMLMKTMQSGDQYLSVIINKGREARDLQLVLKKEIGRPTVIFANRQGTATGTKIHIKAEETMVVIWK